MTAHADPKSSLPSKSDSLDSNERKLNATACQLVRNVLHSLEIDSPYSSSTSSSIPTEIVEPKPTVVSVDSRGTDCPTNLIFASSASMMPTNDAPAVLSEPDEPKYSSPGSNSVNPLGISVDRKCPSHSRIFADLFPTDIFQKPEAFHSIYRSSGVGAASPNSPPIGTTVTDFQNLSSTFTNPSGFSKLSYYSTTNIPPVTQVQAVSNCSPLGDGSAVKLTMPFQIADPIETLNDLNRKLEPFSQSLPSYTPSRAFMRTLNQSLIEFYPHCSTSSTCDRRSSDHLIKPDWLAGMKMETKFESVPKLALPVSPDISKPLSTYHATRRRPPMRKRTKFETTYMSKCTRNALSWWQPLTQHPSNSPLPEPRRDVAQRIALDQRKREARVAKAIAAAERAAKADRAKMFDHVRSKARRIRRLLEPDDKEEHGFQQRCKKCKLLIPSSFPSSKFAKPQFSIISGGNDVEECKKATCTEPFGAAGNWPSQPESRWETAVQTTNRMHDPNNYRLKPRSVSTPKLYNTPTCPKNIDRQYGSYVDLNNKNRTSDTTATRELRHRSRVRSVPRLCDMSVRSTSRSIGKENSGDIDARNEFRSPYRNEPIKFQSPSTLTRLRKRCESVERELTSLAGIKQGYHTSTLNLPTSDCRIDALSAANQVLRRRLNELQSVQQEREKALRKARTMVDELLMKQKIQAELMRKKSVCYNPADPSTWSLCSSPSEPELQATVPHTDSTSTEITTPDPVDHHHLRDRFKHTTFQEGVCTPNDYTGPYRLAKDQHWAEQMRKMNHRANCTQVLLRQLQEDYKKLANNVTRIERNAKRTAHAVQSLMERSHFQGEPTSVVRYSDYSPTRPKHSNHTSNAKSVVDPFVESRLQKARHTLDFLMSEPVRSNCCFSTSMGSRYGCERVKKGNLTYRTDSNPRQCSTLWKSFEQS